jgi:hypothetical protein
MKLYGIKQSELPLVQYSIIISGGHLLDVVKGRSGKRQLRL